MSVTSRTAVRAVVLFTTLSGAGLLTAFSSKLFSSGSPAAAQETTADGETIAGNASVSGLRSIYEKWAKAYSASEPRGPVVTLLYNRGLSSEYSRAKGIAQVDLKKKTVSVRIKGLKNPEVSDVWLVDNLPGNGRSELPEPGDKLVNVGRLTFEKDGNAWLDAKVEQLSDLKLDMVVVARHGKPPGAAGVLYGTTSLFQKLYHYPKQQLAGGQEHPKDKSLADLVVPDAHARGITPPGFFPDLDADLVNEGRDLFLNERFNGNGRTCATCHREEDNMALGLDTIANLPDSDALFLVEQKFRFDGTPNALYQDYRMEKPALTRKVGLILENLDGFREADGSFTTRAVMRAPTHVLSARTTIAPPPAFANDGTLPVNADDLVFAERTGWSGDGTPTGFRTDFFESNGRDLTGSLRDFAVGAVVQHFTRTLERSAFSEDENGNPREPDFRFPTEHELDAIEAFMLSIGRQTENDDLNTIQLFDEIADRGRLNYMGFNVFDADPTDEFPALNCNACHFNGGANTNPDFPFPPGVTPNLDQSVLDENGGSVPSHNRSFGPAVERLADQPGDIIVQVVDDPSVAGDCFDEGLGAVPLFGAEEQPGVPSKGCSANPFDNGFLHGFGDALADQRVAADRFNVPTVFDAMDTPPFFHAHQVNTIEGMVSFYAANRHLRNGDFLGAIVPLNASQVVNVARFLRVMGADFNAESAVRLLKKASGFSVFSYKTRRVDIDLALGEIEDALQLLTPVLLHQKDAVPSFEKAQEVLQNAGFFNSQAVQKAIGLLREAQGAMLVRGLEGGGDDGGDTGGGDDGGGDTGGGDDGGGGGFDACMCNPNKCNDCTGPIANCENTPGCVEIVSCVLQDNACNFPIDTCSNGMNCFDSTGYDQSTAAGQAANGVVSCFGGC